MRDGLHPVQESLSKAHGSQCGFCTPGFVMSMYSLLRQSGEEAPSQHEIEEALAGNLCRCTGYRPILDAFRVFSKEARSAYVNDIVIPNGTVLPNLAQQNGNQEQDEVQVKGKVCPSSGLPCDCSESKCEMNGVCEHGNQQENQYTAEPIFPPELKNRKPTSLELPGQRCSWYRPITLSQLLELKASHPQAKIVVGNTEVGIEMKFKHCEYPVLVSGTHVPELNAFNVHDDRIQIGASVTLTRIMNKFKALISKLPQEKVRGLQAVCRQLKWFAGSQIRNAASLAGNIVTGSPISDLNPLWIALGAKFVVQGKAHGQREINAKDFFLGYRKVDLKEDEVLVEVQVPFTQENEFVMEYKQAHRREDDIAIVNAGMKVVFKELDSQTPTVEQAFISYGGVAPKTISTTNLEAALQGKPWNEETLKQGLEAVKQDVNVGVDAPGGMAEYRNSLAAAFFFKFFVFVSLELEKRLGSEKYQSPFPKEYKSAIDIYEREAAHGVQYFAEVKGENKWVGQAVNHRAADLQVCGEATYLDDMNLPANTLHCALVYSERAYAKLLSIDVSASKQLKGVHGVFRASDVPGDNHIGPILHDEETFATETVTCVGQVIAVVAADTQAIAQEAARLVKVEYEDLPGIFTCEQAIAQDSFYKDANQKIECGNVEQALEQAEHVITGQARVGGQEHFYMEPNACCVIPVENDEYHVWSSTQTPHKHQTTIASVLGIPQHKIVSKTKRLGGGFGGKETRAIFMHAAIAVAAYKLKRPVRLCLDRDEDMQCTGQRHPFLANYKVGFDSRGKTLAVDVQLYSNAGNSFDLSGPVMERALMHSDASYKIPNVRFRGNLCKTNIASNTAFRGFGGPQGMLIAEMWMDQIIRTLNLPPEHVRSSNFYQEGDVTHFGQALVDCRIQQCWDAVMSTSQFQERKAGVDQFNTENRYRKRGIIVTPTKFGIAFTLLFFNQAGALVHIYTDGTVLVTHGGVEMGQGLHTKMCQVAAQEFNIPLDKVFVSETSTDKVPNASPTAASASADLYGMAVLDACKQLNERIQQYRNLGEADAFKQFQQAVSAAHFDRVDLSAHGFHKTPDITGYGGDKPFNYYCYGACCSEVEIDCLTGDFHVLRADICMDVGNPVNPAIDIGQVEGGFIQGMGWFCIEELVWGDEQHKWVKPGVLHTRGPGTYKIPTANDIPIDFRVTLLQNAPNVRAIHSSKAVGEPPLHLGASVFFALKEAIYAARKDSKLEGWFQLDAPATPERIKMACGDNQYGLCQGDGNCVPKISC
eukprot:TRINITY_DN5123_c0_g1_i6.p1 TRINITY_DN5123_c0_g1~~TRINITY_DN5123_c0_g1_i6.p1  ORF type:complete len:1400 (-),score=162.31 TRINITY_DN5123_c0_g1_i6:601-4416(-)